MSLQAYFVKTWAEEIEAYKKVLQLLEGQKRVLLKWDMDEFRQVSGGAAEAINRAHQSTVNRTDAQEGLLLSLELNPDKYSLDEVLPLLTEDDYARRAPILFKGFSSLLKRIDLLSAENKLLIRTGLDIIDSSLNNLACINMEKAIYTPTGYRTGKEKPLLLNTQV